MRLENLGHWRAITLAALRGIRLSSCSSGEAGFRFALSTKVPYAKRPVPGDIVTASAAK